MGAHSRAIGARASRARLVRFAAWAIVTGIAAIQLGVWLGLVYWPSFLPLLILPFLAGALFVARVYPQRRAHLALGAGIAVSVLTVLAAPLIGGYPREIAGRAAMALAGWSLVLWIAIANSAPQDERPASRASRVRWSDARWGWALVAVALVIAALRHHAMVGGFAVLQDEVLYLLQSSWLTEPGFGWTLDRADLALLRPEYTSYRDGVLRTQYPPGWPALLLVFSAVGLRWWSTPILVAAAVGVTWWVGRRLHSPAAGLLAGSLTLLQSWFLESANGYMATAASSLLAVAAAAALLRGESAAGRGRALAWIAAGLLGGAAVAVRPLTGAAITASLALWVLLRRRLRSRSVPWMLAAMAAGALIPGVALLYYNAVSNGHPLTFGYQAVHGELHDLGFGLRGYHLYFGGLEPVVNARLFTPAVAVEAMFARVWDIAADVLPIFLVIPIIWILIATGGRVRWLTAGAFLILPIAYFFYFFSRVRFYTELVPLLMVGLAVLLIELSGRRPRLAGALIALLLAASAARVALGPPDDHGRGREGVLPAARMVDDLAREHGRVIAFIREPIPADMEYQEAHLFRRLAVFNTEGFEGRVVVARDAGPQNARLIRRLPAHQPFLLVLDGDGKPLRVARLPGP